MSADNSSMSTDYPYYKYIKSPQELGMSDKGTLVQMGKDIKGLISYTELLVSGKSAASKTGQPLGNKFFKNTGGKCKDVSGIEQDRYIYINNVPDGSIPFISDGMGVKFDSFRGLIPGAIGNIGALNPASLLKAFVAGTTPECKKITMETINIDNVKSTETHYVATVDIPAGAKMGFANMDNNYNDNNNNYVFSGPRVPDDIVAQAFFASLGGIGIFILYRIMVKSGLVPTIQ
jgi:hypothetical protein